MKEKIVPTREELEALQEAVKTLGYEWAVATERGVTGGNDDSPRDMELAGLKVRRTNLRHRIHFYITGRVKKEIEATAAQGK